MSDEGNGGGGGLWAKAKRHPYITSAIVIGIGLLIIIMFAGGGSKPQATVVSGNSNDVQAGTALAMAQLGAQTNALGISAEQSVQLGAQSTSLEMAKLDNARGARSDELQAAVALSQIAAQARTQELVTTLGASIQKQALETQLGFAKVTADMQNNQLMWDYGKTVTNNQSQQQIQGQLLQFQQNLTAMILNSRT